MFLLISFFITLFFLLGTFFLTALISAFRRIHKRDSKRKIIATSTWFVYRPFHLYFFPNHEYEGLFFSAVCAQNIARFCYAGFAVIFLLATPFFHSVHGSATGGLHDDFFINMWLVFSVIAFLLVSFVFGDYLPRILGMRFPEKVISLCSPIASIFMYLVFPITYLFLSVSQSFSRTIYFDHLHEPDAQAKQEIIEIIQDAELSPGINPHDKKLIESVLSFRERIAREVMVPRVDMFSLPASTTIKEAARLLTDEGYSRIPIYRNTVDEVIGVLMYKDILIKFREYEEKGNDESVLLAPIETIQKSVLYAPETKKLSNLLQEFRKKQVHLAIIVDEYGGTEGIVTIEDILEEIVGDISDEYDDDEAQYRKNADGSWTIDARMSIYDVEELLEIEIPQEDDYETLGGYVFHCAGTIPSKGYTIHEKAFDLQVVDSDERSVETVKIRPFSRKPHSSEHE